MSNVTGQPFVVTQDVALYLQNDIHNTEHLKLFLIVCAELKYAIWTQRNRRKFDGKNPLTVDIERLFLYYVRSRIKADFVRLDNDSFANLWCTGTTALASVAGHCLNVNI